jgi:hypothetical protein
MLVSSALVAFATFSISLASAGTSQSSPSANSRTHIEIRERGSMSTFRGTFVLELNYLNIFDRGTTQLGPEASHATNNVEGQEQRPIHGTDRLTGKKGTLSLKWRSVEIEIDRTSPVEVTIQYGTWQITSGTGVYKSWKGGGRWAAVLGQQLQAVWDGYVTR